jgi:predicted ATP-grasp superfamily ATP-dependent carboligase
VTDPREDGASFTKEIAEIATRDGYDLVLAGSDAALLALSHHGEQVDGPITLGLPETEVVEACLSKIDLLEHARSVGFSCPETALCSSWEDVSAAANALGYPVLLKPRRTVFPARGTLRQQGSRKIFDEVTLRERWPDYGVPCLVQRSEGGPVWSFAGVLAGGEMLAVAVSRYWRTYPLESGAVSFSESVEPPSGLVDAVRSLVSHMGWHGIFELELIDGSAGFSPIDFNPRLYGSLALAVRAGVPIPAIWCDWLLESKTTPRVARAGYYYRWEDGELRNALRELSCGRLSRALGIARPRASTTHAFFSLQDPGPAVARALQGARAGVRSLVNRLR